MNIFFIRFFCLLVFGGQVSLYVAFLVTKYLNHCPAQWGALDLSYSLTAGPLCMWNFKNEVNYIENCMKTWNGKYKWQQFAVVFILGFV